MEKENTEMNIYSYKVKHTAMFSYCKVVYNKRFI